MSDSVNEDPQQRTTTNMEESNAMTIEFLRARLLSERSVSKSARQRADELAKRVAELEEQLKFVFLQRKKAEKATADVLAILENHGASDVSEEFDSCSEQGESPRDFKARNGSSMLKVSLTNTKPRKDGIDTYSSSEIESCPSTGRSLSWRSTKDSQRSLEKKKYMESVRRRASFASNNSSGRKVGKSCRRIRHRDTRSMEELQSDGTDKAACSVDVSDGSNSELVVLRESSGYENGNKQLASATSGSNNETQKINGHYFNVRERNEDMESALEHQAQLIGQYEEEEKAQREWEEKFRENNTGTQDSGDPGNHSDVTEERYEMKSPEPSRVADIMTPENDNQETKQDSVDDRPSQEPTQTSKSLPSLTDADERSSHDEKCSTAINASESEFSFPTSSDKDFPAKHHESSEHRFQQYLPMMPHTKTSYDISSPLELAFVPQEPSNNLGSVLEALQKAKLSLNQKLNNLPPNPETNKVGSFEMPFNSPGLFRLPTDYQFETGIDARPSFANFLPKNALGRFLSIPSVESRSGLSGDNVSLMTAPYRPFNQEIRPGVSPERSFSSSTSSKTNNLDPYTNPSVKDSYPFLQDVTLRLPLNEEGTSRTFPSSSERGLPSVMRLSSYDEHVRPNMYR